MDKSEPVFYNNIVTKYKKHRKFWFGRLIRCFLFQNDAMHRLLLYEYINTDAKNMQQRK